jgi:DNA-binding NarL/FixJ family response regulator
MNDSMSTTKPDLAPSISITTSTALDAAAAQYRLSAREREIARLLIDGYAALNVAAVLELSENTVRTYVRRLYKKLNVSNRADLVCRLLTARAA